MKVIKEEYFNVQSYVHVVYDLSPDINVFVGRPNAGKSIRIKAKRMACIPNFYTAKERKKFIRKGCEYAQVNWTLEDGSVVVFTRYLTYQTYEYLGEFYRQDEMPQEIALAMGLYIDRESKIVLNLLDLEQPMPFLQSSNQESARWLNFIIEHKEMKNIIENLELYQSELEELKDVAAQTLHTYKVKDMQYVTVVTAALEDSIKRREVLLDTAEKYDRMLNVLRTELILPVPVEKQPDTKELKNLMTIFWNISKIPEEPAYVGNRPDLAELRLMLRLVKSISSIPEIPKPPVRVSNCIDLTLYKLYELLAKTEKEIEEIEVVKDNSKSILERDTCPYCGKLLDKDDSCGS